MNHEVLGSILTQIREGRTYSNLDTLSHTLTDLHIVLTVHILLNISCQIISSRTDGVVGNDTTE